MSVTKNIKVMKWFNKKEIIKSEYMPGLGANGVGTFCVLKAPNQRIRILRINGYDIKLRFSKFERGAYWEKYPVTLKFR